MDRLRGVELHVDIDRELITLSVVSWCSINHRGDLLDRIVTIVGLVQDILSYHIAIL